MGNHKAVGKDGDYSLHIPAFISATDPSIAGGTGATGVASGQWWLEHTGGDADALEALWYRNAANDGWVNILTAIVGIQNPASIATGDVIYGSATDTLAALAIGSEDEVLAVSAGGIPEWVDLGLGLQNPATATTGDVVYASGANTLAMLAIGTEDQVLTVSAGGIPEWADATGGSGLDNPASAATGDIIYASASNTLSVLNIGTEDQVLTVSAGGIPEWAAASGGGGYGDGDTLLAASGTTSNPGIAFNANVDCGWLFDPSFGDKIIMVVNAAEVWRADGTTFRVSDPIYLTAAGSAAAPAIALGVTNDGFFTSGSGVGVTDGGSQVAVFGSSFVDITAPHIRVPDAGVVFRSETTTYVRRIATGTVAITCQSSNAATFKNDFGLFCTLNGNVDLPDLPGSDPAVSGRLYVDGSGFVKQSA